MKAPARLAAAAGSLLLVAAAAGCGAGGGTTADGDGAGTLTVFAAASLQEPFEELGERFEAEHSGVTVEFSFAGSSTLVEQIRQGAPADVLASADTATMAALVEAELNAAPPEDFATNTLTIAVPAGNPAGITGMDSLVGEDVSLVICAPVVPCGAAARSVADAAGLALSPVSEEQSVTDVLNKVVAGEADAGLVYVTDVHRAGDRVDAITIPEAAAAVNTYPIATLAGAAHPDLAEQFLQLVLDETGQDVLADYGFGPAPA